MRGLNSNQKVFFVGSKILVGGMTIVEGEIRRNCSDKAFNGKNLGMGTQSSRKVPKNGILL